MMTSNTASNPGSRQALEAQWLAADENLRDALSRFATQARFEDEFLDAVLEFWGVEDPEEMPVELEEDSAEFMLTFEWYLYDHRERETGKRLIELFSEVEGSHLPALEQELLASWLDATLCPYEVTAVQSGAGYVVRSLLDDKEYAVDDHPTSEELRPGDLMVSRLLPLGGRVRPSSVFRTFPPSDLPRLEVCLQEWLDEYRRDAPQADWAEFLHDEGYLFNDYTLERQALAARMGQTPGPEPADGAREPLSERDPAQRDAMQRALERAYCSWLDRPSPALDGLTPRQAVGTPQQRQPVLTLLTAMGEIEASYAVVGEPAYEIARLLPSLGLSIADLG